MTTHDKDSRRLLEGEAKVGALVPVHRPSPEEDSMDESDGNQDILVLLPVKNSVLFPHNVVPVTPLPSFGVEALERAARQGTRVGIVALRQEPRDPIEPDDLYLVGTEAKIIKVIRFPDGTSGAVVQGTRRFKIQSFKVRKGHPLEAVVQFPQPVSPEESLELAALERGLKQLIQKAVSLSPNIPAEANIFIENVTDACYLADLVVPYLSISAAEKQLLLETEEPLERLRRVQLFLTREIEILEMTQRIQSEIKGEVGKQQRRFYVKEQLKLLQKELGELDGKTATSSSSEPQDLRERIEKSKMTAEARAAAMREVERMGAMQAGSPEHTVSQTYVNWLLDIPWGIHSQSTIRLSEARALLESEHHGLQKVKKRVLEFLAVYALKGDLKGPILLFVGPPGVGKTSLGKSVAKALGRKFQRIALGGVRDESEIRGHRRTYIGSMPGKIADALKKAGTMDPVILLDEVDKISADVRGDPSSALLEVLDSEQNHSFMDHYLNVPLDLSRVLFIGTANTLSTLQGPLRDRMEIVELDSYTLEEKVSIAQNHLLPQVAEEHGLRGQLDFSLSDSLMSELIRNYTREAGVRQLRRELSSVARGLVTEYVEARGDLTKLSPAKGRKRALTKKDVVRLLGPASFLEQHKSSRLALGVATGLAYTSVGGDVLQIESARVENGKGQLTITGQLGDVMKESVQTTLALIKSKATLCGVDLKKIQSCDLHVHFPAGAVKKDGPSAGIAVFSALVGLFSERPLSADLAMTGEISLRGDVLAVGGIKEKLLAAHRFGIKKVLIPFDNLRDLDDLPESAKKELWIVGVRRIEEVLEHVFGRKTPSEVKRGGRLSRP
jgi:ATP-dependent Lon protease